MPPCGAAPAIAFSQLVTLYAMPVFYTADFTTYFDSRPSSAASSRWKRCRKR